MLKEKCFAFYRENKVSITKKKSKEQKEDE